MMPLERGYIIIYYIKICIRKAMGASMLKNFFLVAIRNILRQKAYALINVVGLAIGLACSLLITIFIFHELSYDKFHEKVDRIYRLGVSLKIGEMDGDQAWTAVPTASAFLDEFPEIIDATRLERWSDILIRYEDKAFIEDDILWADSSFFNIFSFKLIKGDPDKALKEPQTIVLSESMANKYFGDEDPIDKVLKLFSDTSHYRVTGVVEDPPENSHITYNFIGSYISLDKAKNIFWLSHSLYTYFLLEKGVDPGLLEEKIQPVMMKYIGPQVEQVLGITPDQWIEQGNQYGMFLQPLMDIHLNTDVAHGMKPSHEKKYIYIFSVIAVFILIIACINFMNLSTARSASRAREVGMRKVLGSGKNLLINQFLWESIIMSFISLILALLIVEVLLPYFNNLINLRLTLNYFDLWYIIPGLILLVILVGIIAGSYPAFYLSSFRPVAVLTGKLASGMRTGYLRSILVVLQFTISVGIIISTLFMYRQIQYLLNKDLGYNKEQLLVIDRVGAVGIGKIQTFKQELARVPGVVSSTNSTMIMGHPNNTNAYMIEGRPLQQNFVLATNWVDFDFADTYELETVTGRYLSKEIASDSVNAVVNEAAVKAFNMEDPLSIRLIQPGETQGDWSYHPIIGVVRDFHFTSLHEKIQPYIFMHKPEDWGWGGYLTVRLEAQNIRATVNEIGNVWKEFTHDQPFEYYFLDEDFTSQYVEEQRTSKIFTVFSILAIFVACLGLLGLSAFSAEQRTKEIGVRKVMGATIPVIVRLLSRETVFLVLVATIPAVLVSWYYMRKWLESFAYRINIDPLLFFLAFLAVLIIALITVSFQAVNAALKNPAESLRYE